jgi:hypothetical protein
MTLADFKALSDVSKFPLPLQALWYDGHGHWSRAHTLAQEAGNRDGAWVHAYLHRKEGDDSNASYWYATAGRPMPEGSLDAEWEMIATELLTRAPASQPPGSE